MLLPVNEERARGREKEHIVQSAISTFLFSIEYYSYFEELDNAVEGIPVA